MRPNKYQRPYKLTNRASNIGQQDLQGSIKGSIGPFSGSFNFPGVIKYFFSRLLKDFGISTALVYMYNSEAREIDLVGYTGVSEDKLLSLKNFPIQEFDRDILSKTIINQAIFKEGQGEISPSLKMLKPLSVISVPVFFSREVLGVLVIIKSSVFERFCFDPDLFQMHYFLLSAGIKIFDFLKKGDLGHFRQDNTSKYEMDLQKILIYQRIINSMIKEFSFLEFIVNPLEALRKKITSEELLSILDGIHYVLDDAFNRVRKIKEFTNIKIEETISEISLSVFDPVELIDFEKIKARANSKRVEIVSNIEKGNRIKAKRDEIKKAFFEIFNNLFQFISRDSTLMISTYNDKNYFSISIVNTTDNDVFDMEKDSLEPFVSNSPWAMGLGFSIAFSLIARNKGQLLFFSQDNHTFTTRIIFPIHYEICRREECKKSILVIDDDRTFMDMMYEILIDRGYYVDTAMNAEEAVEKASSSLHVYDAVICDIKLPDKDGWWVLDRLHHLEETRGFKIPQFILTSGYLDELDRSKMLKYGVNYSITKPFRYIDLINVLNRAL